MIVTNDLFLTVFVGLWLEAVLFELPHHEENGQDEETSHVGVEWARHRGELSILDILNDFQLAWVTTSLERDTSDDSVGTSNGGGHDDCGPAEVEAERGSDHAHEDDEDPEDYLWASINLVDERVVENECEHDSTPSCSNSDAKSEEFGEDETANHAYKKAPGED